MKFTTKVLILAMSFLLTSLAFAEDAGKILFAYGKISVERNGKSLNAKQGFAIQKGDTVKTGANAIAQIKLGDNTLIALKPDTSWNLSQYEYDRKNPGLGKQSSELVKGGLRAITGAMGKANPKNIEYTAGTTTIGIRGTTLEIQNNLTGANKGVYIRVETGAVLAKTAIDSINLTANQAARVLQNNRFERTLAKDIFVPVSKVMQEIKSKNKKEAKEVAEPSNNSGLKEVGTVVLSGGSKNLSDRVSKTSKTGLVKSDVNDRGQITFLGAASNRNNKNSNFEILSSKKSVVTLHSDNLVGLESKNSNPNSNLPNLTLTSELPNRTFSPANTGSPVYDKLRKEITLGADSVKFKLEDLIKAGFVDPLNTNTSKGFDLDIATTIRKSKIKINRIEIDETTSVTPVIVKPGNNLVVNPLPNPHNIKPNP